MTWLFVAAGVALVLAASLIWDVRALYARQLTEWQGNRAAHRYSRSPDRTVWQGVLESGRGCFRHRRRRDGCSECWLVAVDRELEDIQ